MPTTRRYSAGWKKWPISKLSASGRRPPNSAIAPRSKRCLNLHCMGQTRRAQRSVQRREVPQFRALLHHPDAPARRRERHHHRQPPSVFRRPRDQGRKLRRRNSSRLPRRGLRRSPRDRRRGRTVFRLRGEQLPVMDCAAISPPSAA